MVIQLFALIILLFFQPSVHAQPAIRKFSDGANVAYIGLLPGIANWISCSRKTLQDPPDTIFMCITFTIDKYDAREKYVKYYRGNHAQTFNELATLYEEQEKEKITKKEPLS